MVWYSHLFQDFPQFIVMYTVKGFGIVNKAEIEVFLELSCFGGNSGNSVRLYFWGSKITADVNAAMKLKDAYSLEGKL